MSLCGHTQRMSLSIKTITNKFPIGWYRDINPNETIIDQIFKEAVEIGAYENNARDEFLVRHGLTICTNCWPNFNDESLEFVCRTLLWLITVDDILDSETLPDTESIPLVKRVQESILKLTNGRNDLFNLHITTCIQWLKSVIPFCKTKDLSKPPHYELFSYIRDVNVATNVCILATIVGLRAQLQRENGGGNIGIGMGIDIDIGYLYDPRWMILNQSVSMIVALVNEVASYGKEIDQGIGDLNLMSSLSKGLGLTLEQTYELILQKIDEYLSVCFEYEQSFLLNIKQQQEQQKQEIQYSFYKQLMEQLHYLITGNLNWSLTSKRYRSNSSPFIELLK
eukprot:gene5634-7012_t